MTQEAPFRIEVGQRSDVGRVRAENQDSATSSYAIPVMPLASKGRLLVVADGMGGQSGGATASRLATATVKDSYYFGATQDLGESLRAAIASANQKINSEASADQSLEGMGSTCSALVIKGREAFFGHVGDSRIYRVRDGQIEQLTEDHSVVATLLKSGLITTEQAAKHPARNQLMRAIGPLPLVDIDISPPFPIREGDVFILCSDGLHGVVTSEEIRDIGRASAPQGAVDQLVDLALSRGAPDNVTVIVARIEAPAPQ
ncbi:MAG: PP2C family serine/threonine-protein phosphatase [Acidobacteriota bacterium]